MNVSLLLTFFLLQFQIPQWQDPGEFKGICFDPKDGQTAYVLASKAGIFKTDEAGDSWVQIIPYSGRNGQPFPQDEQFQAMCINPANSAELFLAGRRTIYKSPDRGLTWVKTAEFSNMQDGEGFNSLAVNPKYPLEIYAGVSMNYRFLKSVDGGRTWQTGISSIAEDVHIIQFAFDSRAYKDVLAVAFRSFPRLDQKSYYQIYKSENKGKFFETLSERYDRIEAISALPGRRGGLLMSADTKIGTNSGNGIFKSYYGGKLWRKKISGWFRSIAPSQSNPNVIYAAGEKLLKSEDWGDTFLELVPPEDTFFRYCAVSPGNEDFLFVQGENKIMYRSKDGGKAWQNVLDLNTP